MCRNKKPSCINFLVNECICVAIMYSTDSLHRLAHRSCHLRFYAWAQCRVHHKRNSWNMTSCQGISPNWDRMSWHCLWFESDIIHSNIRHLWSSGKDSNLFRAVWYSNMLHQLQGIMIEQCLNPILVMSIAQRQMLEYLPIRGLKHLLNICPVPTLSWFTSDIEERQCRFFAINNAIENWKTE